jgi:hypothetical protein
MLLSVKGEACWEVKPGMYLGEIVFAGPYEKPSTGRKQVRIVFSLDYDDGSGREFKVQRMYDTSIRPGDDLYADIEVLMGKGCLSSRKDFELDQLVHRKAMIHVVHSHSAKHKKPFVTFDQILPPPVVSDCQSQPASDSNRDQLAEDLAAIEKQIQQLTGCRDESIDFLGRKRKTICRN